MSDPLATNTGGAAVEKLAYKLQEAAVALGISEISVRRLVARGLLRPVRALRHLVFSKAELTRFLQDN